MREAKEGRQSGLGEWRRRGLERWRYGRWCGNGRVVGRPAYAHFFSARVNSNHLGPALGVQGGYTIVSVNGPITAGSLRSRYNDVRWCPDVGRVSRDPLLVPSLPAPPFKHPCPSNHLSTLYMYFTFGGTAISFDLTPDSTHIGCVLMFIHESMTSTVLFLPILTSCNFSLRVVLCD